MKKKMSIIILLLVAVSITACGTKETVVDADVSVNKPVEGESVKAPVTTPEVSEPVSTPEPAAPAVSDKIDRIVDVDIPVGSQSEKVELPELHMYVTGALVEQVSSGTTKYEIPNATILLRVSASYFQDPEPCWESYMAPHYETADYGRYIVDIDSHKNNDSEIEFFYETTNITVYDTQLCGGVTITIALNITNETAPTDAELKYIKQYGLMEAEYIKEQVSQWSQDFVPGSGAEVGTTAPVEAVAEEKVYALDAYPDITVTLKYSADGTVEILCQSPSDATIQQTLVQTDDGKLQALSEDGEMFMEITVNDGKIFVDTPFMEYANFFGDYTLKE